MFRNQYTFHFVWDSQNPHMNNFIKMEVSQHPNQTSLMYSHIRDITETQEKYFGVSKVVEVDIVGVDYNEAYERATTLLNTYITSLHKDTHDDVFPDDKPLTRQKFLESIESLIGGIKNDIRETIQHQQKKR